MCDLVDMNRIYHPLRFTSTHLTSHLTVWARVYDYEARASSKFNDDAHPQAAAAAREIEFGAQRERDRLRREREAAEFDAFKENMIEESRRILGTAVEEAKQESESTAQSRWDHTVFVFGLQHMRNVEQIQSVSSSCTPHGGKVSKI